MWGRKRKEKRALKKAQPFLKNYYEGIRLMRFGDGADEFAGMHIARKAREELRNLGYDVDGTRPDLKGIR